MDSNAFETTLDALRSHRAETAAMSMRDVFAVDPGRADRDTATLDDLSIDFSKCAVDVETMRLLTALAKAAGVEERRDAMFAGARINTTEDRAVLHVALRNRPDRPIRVDGADVMPEVRAVLDAMRRYSDGIRAGTIRGATGKPITDIVNIGIGGSDLGPVMATLALAPFHDGPRTHYVSNVDGAHIADTLAGLDPASTLFIVASKTFT
ncbi:MAG: glucose-6-phosphate isomerase, partial [Caldilineaceae bacterium]|nr:glucose-6-phosphate isomerase [Caldilineaceae bacterium]